LNPEAGRKPLVNHISAQEAVTTTASPSGASTTFNPQAWAKSRV
jgi:hypothetical protein